MRLLPADVALRLIAGQSLRMCTRNQPKEQRIREGHRMLVKMCGCDHGYDLIAWHNELCTTKAGGYRWNKSPGIPKMIQNAMNDSNWVETVAEIERVDAARMARRKAKRKRQITTR
ncbi:MAG: hypothetical protein KDA83_18870 [Planctomycetales bacterium]|nr:hypothetical protein [Planctomycetales bacterium]